MPSSLTAPVATPIPPTGIAGDKAAQLPTRMKHDVPQAASSSTAMAIDGEPTPLVATVSRAPSRMPVNTE